MFIFQLMFLAWCLVETIHGFKPVIIIHGLKQAATSLFDLRDFIVASNPGTQVTVMDLYQKAESYEAPMMKQVEDFGDAIKKISDANPGGFHLIGFSQGGLIARGVLETVPNLNIDTFISLSSPQMGQFGELPNLRKRIPGFLLKAGLKELYRFLYNVRGQALSFGGYWVDPMHIDSYRSSSKFLPYLNNETSATDHAADSYAWKNNFLRVKKLVLIGGPDDGTITPWQSAQFGYYADCVKDLTIVPMQQQQVYLKDSFGLRTMDAGQRIVTYTIPNTNHTMMHRNPAVFNTAIKPHLT